MEEKYPLIIKQLVSRNWAMESRALKTLRDIINGDKIDGQIFHLNEPIKHKSVIANIGESIDGTKISYRMGSLGILDIYGPIIPYSSWLEKASGFTSVQTIMRENNALNEDKSIKNKLILFDTPGGDVDGISEVAQQIFESSKPTYGHITGMAASAGYWLISQTKKITSVDTGRSGSIGVVTSFIDYSKLDEKRGIKRYEITSSKAKRKRTDLTTEEGRTELQAILDGIEDIFINNVAIGRNIEPKTVNEKFGNGGMFIAKEALERGMIDGITTTTELLARLQDENKKTKLFTMTAKQGSKIIMSKEKEKDKALDVTTSGYVAIDNSFDKEDTENKAIEREQKRLQAIESIAKDFELYHQDVRDSVAQMIQEEKYNKYATEMTVRNKALKIAIDEQNKIIEKMRSSRSDLTKIVSHLPVDGQETDADIDAQKKRRIENMTKGYEKKTAYNK
jgi:ClpP class serine protease